MKTDFDIVAAAKEVPSTWRQTRGAAEDRSWKGRNATAQRQACE